MIYLYALLVFNAGFIGGAYWRGNRAIREHRKMQGDIDNIIRMVRDNHS